VKRFVFSIATVLVGPPFAAITVLVLAKPDKGNRMDGLLSLLFFSPFLIGVLIVCVYISLDILRMHRTNFDNMSDEVLEAEFREHFGYDFKDSK
jgi:hypothetical protein